MGFSTNVTVQNDFLHNVIKEPEKLARAIQIEMNYGSEGDPFYDVNRARDVRDGRLELVRHMNEVARWARSNYVRVHKACHNDDPQIIVSTPHNHGIAAHELPFAISQGWLDLRLYNRKHAKDIVKELRKLADDIEDGLK